MNRHLPPKLRGTTTQRRIREYLTANKGRDDETDYLSPRVFTEAAQWVEQAVARRRPFALVVDSFDPHEPWDPAPRYLRRFGPGRIGAVKPIQPFAPPGGALKQFGLSRAAMRRVRNLYAAELAMVDTWLGLFLARVEQLGLMQNTLIVLLSDHGVLLGERGEVGKTRGPDAPGDHARAAADPRPGAAGAPDARATTSPPPTTSRPPCSRCSAGRCRAPMDGVDLSVLLRGRARAAAADLHRQLRPVGERRRRALAADRRQPRAQTSACMTPAATRASGATWPRGIPAVVRRLWRQVIADAGGRRLPRF